MKAQHVKVGVLTGSCLNIHIQVCKKNVVFFFSSKQELRVHTAPNLPTPNEEKNDLFA
jgi:hypothetical protein